jgi:hypothetical protein
MRMAVAMFHVEHLLPLALMRAVEGLDGAVAAIVVLVLTNHGDQQSAFSLSLHAGRVTGLQHVSGIALGSATLGDWVSRLAPVTESTRGSVGRVLGSLTGHLPLAHQLPVTRQ